MIRLGIGNAWKWAIPQLVGFVVLLCWVDPTSRPIIGIFLFVFLAILGISIFEYQGTPRQTLPISKDAGRAFVPTAATRRAARCSSDPKPPPSSAGIVAAPQPPPPASTADPSSKAGHSEACPPPKPLPAPAIVLAPRLELPAS